MEKSSKEFLAFMRLPCVCGPRRGSHNTKLGNNQVYESHCKRFRCHRQCPKWRFYQGNHQGEAARFLCGEGDQNQTNATVVTPSTGIYENIALRN